MMENKPRLTINRIALTGEKSPPATKLLINHGKPNFTIVKSPKPKCTLLPEEKIFFVGDLKPSDFKKRPTKVIHQNGATNEASTDAEFMRLHKKIGGKNIDEDYTDSNGNVAAYKVNLPKDQHFATLERNCILTVKSVSNSNDIVVDTDPSQTNGKAEVLSEKPPTPGKPENLKILQKNSTHHSPSGRQLSPTTNAGVTNFEQRTVVSFAKDLGVMPNRYPDTVKISKTLDINSSAKPLPKEFSDLKFKIASNGDVVMPVKQTLA